MDQKLVASLFQSADEDKDGAISGGEAVRFFARSGLAQDILGKVNLLQRHQSLNIHLHGYFTSLSVLALTFYIQYRFGS